MILKHKKALILSSLAILLPIPVWALLRSRMPDPLNMSWFFWGGPLIMLAFHWLCVLFTVLDPGNRGRNKKITALVLWIIPLINTLSYFGLYALNLGLEFSPVACTMVPMGILLAVIGNYMPKTRMNSTVGIKIPTTYSSEENWNATHRFAGKLWVTGGVLLIPLGFVPHGWAVALMFADLMVITLVPMAYSWRYYKKELAAADLLAAADAGTIVDYLHNSHAFYLDRELAALESNLSLMVEPCDELQKKIVGKFFASYKAQVQRHFNYEESVVFPYVRALKTGECQEGYSIEQFEENHSNIDETLNDLKNIVMKYLPDTCDTVVRNEVLYRIYRLEEDLLKHTIIEDTVLIPVVNRMETL